LLKSGVIILPGENYSRNIKDKILNDFRASIQYHENLAVSNSDLNSLFNASWPDHQASDFQHVLAHSLGFVCALSAGQLIGFVNLAWDGGIHAFLLDITVHPAWRRQGLGRELVLHAVDLARKRGIVWLHVDYEPQLESFYRGCGFVPTLAGLINFKT
jgi:ribosomal protein S18 acetylase RimI-like enzyme